jgi:hypothetical protein
MQLMVYSVTLDVICGENNLELQIEMTALSILDKVHQFLSQRQIEAYIVGGFVRDTLIGRRDGDIDLAKGRRSADCS